MQAPSLEAEIQVFPMKRCDVNVSTIADSQADAEFWDILVTARNPDTGEVLPVLEIENLSFEDASDWVEKLEAHSGLEAEWIDP